jgi:hypothetical protein
VTSDKPINAMQGTFSCAQPGCTNIFQKYLNLESHIVFGKQFFFLAIRLHSVTLKTNGNNLAYL